MINFSYYDNEKREGIITYLTKNFGNNSHRVVSLREDNMRYDIYFSRINGIMTLEGEALNYTFTWR